MGDHGHDHSHGHDHDHGHSAPDASRRLSGVLALVVVYALVEAGVGWWSGSLALLADAGHMFSDAGALLLALFAARLARRPPDERRTMGWGRAEVLGATINAAMLLAIAVMIVVEAVERLGSGHEIIAGPMLVVAAIGLLINLVSAWILHASGGEDLNLRAALWHVLGDALGSVGAIVAAVLILTLDWTAADALVSLLICIILMAGASRILREAADVLMQATPRGVELDRVRAALLEDHAVCGLHNLHLWSLAPGTNVLSVHVVLEDGYEPREVTLRLEGRLRQVVALEHLTIQVEVGEAVCPQAPVAH